MENASVAKDFSNKELQYNDTLKQWEIHKALDLASDTSNNVLAIANGTVTNVYNNYLEGGVIEITHDNGIKSVYKSLEEISVKNGDYVKKKELALEIFGLNLFLSNKTLILKGSSGAGGGGENGPRAPFHEAHFRLLSELRSVIKKSRDKRGNFKVSSEMVPETGLEPAHQMAYAPKAYVYTNFTTRA